MSRRNDDPKNSAGLGPDQASDPEFAKLRSQAEQQARRLESNQIDAEWPTEARSLLHELRVHQI